MLAEGLGNKKIAGQLGISDHTAKFHVASILGKLHAQTRTEAVTIGVSCGLVPDMTIQNDEGLAQTLAIAVPSPEGVVSSHEWLPVCIGA
jgi:hypothetical protein